MGKPVIWTVWVGSSGGGRRVSLKKVYEGPTKRKAVVAARNAQGGKFCPILRNGHSYIVVPRR